MLPFSVVRDADYQALAATRRSETLTLPEEDLSVCASADDASAAHYAWVHNRDGDDYTPLIVEFGADAADAADVAVDGRNMLYTLFQRENPDRAPAAVEAAYGKAAVRHLNAAWATDNHLERTAHCDRAVLNPLVVAHHYLTRIVIAGRCGTVFSSAFRVRLPVGSCAIRHVHVTSERSGSLTPEIRFDQLIHRDV